MSDNSSYSYEENEDDRFSGEEEEEEDEIDEINDLILSGSDNSQDSESSEDSDTDVITLKSTMIFPKKSQVITPIPQLKGIVLPTPKSQVIVSKQKIELPNKNVKKYSAEEIETLIQKIPGINISNNPIDYDRLDIFDLLEKEAQESIKDFLTRKEITLKINGIDDPKIKNNTCVVLGFMIAKKLRFGIKYDDNTELLIKNILDMLA